MIRMSKETDYGIILLAHLALGGRGMTHSAREVAGVTYLPVPMVSKVLKILTREGFLVSHRGVKGGYRLAQPPERVSVADVISAMEGPIAVTECTEAEGECRHEPVCQLKPSWRKINQAVLVALDNITLSDLVESLREESGASAAQGLVSLQ